MRGLSCKRSAIYTLRRKLKRGQSIDRRGRPRHRSWNMDPELWELTLTAYLQPNRLPLTEVLRYVNGLALQQGKPPLEYNRVRRRLRREVPKRDRVRSREGPKAFEARCVPKIARAYEMPAGEW